MPNKYFIYVAAIITIVSLLSSVFIYLNYSSQIQDLKSQNSDLQAQINSLQNTSTNQTATQNITLVDDEGYVTTLSSVPQTIVSLAPSATQICFAIGVGDKVVGVTNYDNYPYNFSAWIAAGNMTDVGLYGTPNMEAIATLNPGLIISDTQNDASIPNMRSLGYKVIVLNPTTVTGVEQDIALVGRATGAEVQATALVNNMTTTLNNISAKIAAANVTAPTVYYEVWNDPLMSAGSGSWITDAIAKAGGMNIFANESVAYPTISSETVVELNPNVILLPSGSGGMAFYGSVAQVEARPGWNTISAVQNNRVYVINQDLFAEPGPRIVTLVQDIAACLYPQLFNSTS